MENPGLFVRNYKSFGPSGARIPKIDGLLLVVGRNNSGKSSLLDAIEIACSPKVIENRHSHSGGECGVYLTGELTETEVTAAMSPNIYTSDGVRPYQDFGQYLVGDEVCISVATNKNTDQNFFEVNSHTVHRMKKHGIDNLYFDISRRIKSPLKGRNYRKLSAERDVRAEERLQLGISSNGDGVAGTIAAIINKIEYDRNLVQVGVLRYLNEIMEPDSSFEEISVQLNEISRWEIMLQSQKHGLIRLSDSGSGIKTVLSVICMIELCPFIDGEEISDYVFAFEELENNIRPCKDA